MSTFTALERQEGVCPICGNEIRLSGRNKSPDLVGHHIVNRCFGRIDTADNCEARHASCERWAHKTVRDGNPSYAQISLYRDTLMPEGAFARFCTF